MKKIKQNFTNVAIILVACACYFNTLNGKFVFDDSEAIVKNNDLDLSVSWVNVFKNDFWGTNISSDTSHKSYRPLTVLFYRGIILTCGSKDPFYFHVTNVILYAILCILFYHVMTIISRNRKIAFLSSILYSVHPIHSEVVSSIVGQADMLCAITFFVGLCFYIKFISSETPIYYLLTLITALISMLCKETGITLLAMCSLCDILLETYRTSFFNKKLLQRQIIIVLMITSFIYLRWSIMDFRGPKFQPMDNPASFADNLHTRVLSYSYIYLLNFILLLWPQWLCFDWAMGCVPLINNFYDYRMLFVLVFYITCIIFVFIQLLRRSKLTIFALILLTVPFIPASNILLRVGFVIAERTLLLPSAGFCVLVVIGYMRLCEYKPKYTKIFKVFYWGLCVFFALKSHHRAYQWVTEDKLFNSALEICPLNAKVHYNIAKIAVDNGELVKAEHEYRKAISLHPKYDQAMNNLANLLRDKNELREAKDLLLHALEIRSDFAAAWMNLGIVLATLNHDKQAEEAYATALNHRNNYPDCFYNLGNLYLKWEKNEAALEMWKKATELKPTHAAAWSNQLVLLDTLGEWNRAIEVGNIAIQENPNIPALYFTLANTLGKLKRWEDAERNFLTSIQLNPKNALYYSNLGVLYHRWGKLDEAKHFYKEALKLNPSLESTATNLKKLR